MLICFDKHYSKNDVVDTVKEGLQDLNVTEEETDDGPPKACNEDIFRKLLIALRSFIKVIPFSNKSETTVVSAEELKDCCDDIIEEENEVVLTIINSLAPYIPAKKYYCLIIHQLPVVILANDVLEPTGYEKFTRQVCPMPSLSSQALKIDDPALYSIPTRKGDNLLYLYDYGGYIIESVEFTRRHQDEVFGLVFD